MLLLGTLASTIPRLDPGMGIEGLLPRALGAAVTGLASAALGLVLWLITLFVFLIPTLSRLRDFNASAFGTPATLIKIGLCYRARTTALRLSNHHRSCVHSVDRGRLRGLAIIGLGTVFLLIGFIGLIIGCALQI